MIKILIEKIIQHSMSKNISSFSRGYSKPTLAIPVYGMHKYTLRNMSMVLAQAEQRQDDKFVGTLNSYG